MRLKAFLKKYTPPNVWQFLKEQIKNELDEVLIAKKFFRGRSKGIMIDVGACHGTSLLPFLALKWKIYAFEPDIDNLKYLKSYLGKWGLLNKVSVLNKAVSEKKGELSFYKSKDSIGISSLNKFHHNHVFSHKVECTTLNEFVLEENINDIGFLKIDTEGFDLFVLKGLDFTKVKPTFILCEFEDSKTKNQDYGFIDIIEYLEERGYKTLISLWEPIIQYGGKHKWNKFTTNVKDVEENQWGNILAVQENDFPSLLKICKLD